MTKISSINKAVLAGIGIAGISYLSSKNNRQKARVMLQNAKVKADSWITKMKHKKSSLTKVGHSDPYDFEDHQMLSEGAMYGVDYYNQEEQQS
ncbi:hypothetical protein AN964_01590 [Heyndrickxia shackletonii]|uniref:Uncharacterized protein n=1 Tax=Heyndrickxia shackletonii TaxID=157838 RepID=A0A0Q3TE33_9BACI|nr:hypothetical protein [Heyndrickxia shackletonii]KQL52360.1 hypothetical protein AN964_01590 [Heyndrickxia shackletonii]MBB2483487.1 hypothetical protein [Bacillus sp. APMAM]NEY99081.1 hypothetical protein [Heyndrickxia shackletonii]RTZ53087.1 hypothetical protein EKO25_25280 [Bacillus sp. SAJ1]